MAGENLLTILGYVCLASLVVGGISGIIARVAFAQISKRKPAKSILSSVGIGFFITMLSGGVYFFVSLNNTAQEVAENISGYGKMYALTNDYTAIGQYMNSVGEKLATDAVIGSLIGAALTITVVALACHTPTQPSNTNESSINEN